MPGGRPTTFTDEVIRKLEEAFALDCTVEEACFYADIARTTYYDNVKIRPELANRFEELRQRPFLLARQTIVKHLNHPEHAKWYMERKKKQEFSQRNELTGKDGDNLVPKPIMDISKSNVQQDNSNQQNNRDGEEVKNSTGGVVSEQDNINSSILDSLSPNG